MDRNKRPQGPHWSASRFMLFEQCPEQYRSRYVDGVVAMPSLAMLFGHTVHTALEVLLQGHRGVCPVCLRQNVDHGECARDRYWRSFDTMRAELMPANVEASSLLYLEGLRMIDQVAYLGLNDDSTSRPERWFTIPASEAALDKPVVGAIDLWSPPWSKHGAVIFDFKTTVGSWSQERAERERWQPLLYTWAYSRAYDVVPTFRYIVLNRTDGSINQFDRDWSSLSEWKQDLNLLRASMEEIAEAAAAGNFSCAKRHGSCLECGQSYGHQHVCREPKRHKLTLSRSNGQAAANLV